LTEKTFDRAYFWLVVPVVAALISIGRVWRVLPAVMQDEYIYSIQARFTPFAEQLYPNYLFSSLYSVTNLCGDEFYSCAKSLNAAFYLATLLLVFFIARSFFNITISTFITTVAAISPLNVYVSFFMPESMYFAFILATVLISIRAGRNGKLKLWLLAGVILGLTALVKPHALFTLPAFTLFSFLTALRQPLGNTSLALLKSFAFFGSFMATKFGLGFVYAGSSGLTFFGSTYESTLQNLNSLQSSPMSNPIAATSVNSLAVSDGPIVPGLLDVAIPHAVAHLGIMAIISAFPLMMSLGVFLRIVKKKEPIGDASQFIFLIGSLAVSMAIAVAIFEGIVSTTGDDHSARLITRYYEFLWPLLLVAASLFSRFVEPKTIWRILQALFAVTLVTYLLIYSNGIKQEFSDSILLSGYLSTPGVFFTVGAVGILISLIWVASKNNGTKLITWFFTPFALLAAGISSQSLLLTQIGIQKAFFDIAGETSKQYLAGVDGSKILIVGLKRTDVFVAKFWIDKPGIRDIYLDEGQTLSKTTIGDAEYVLNLSNTFAEGNQSIVAEGNGFRLVKMENVN
jgi:phosphoglycerol transferase